MLKTDVKTELDRQTDILVALGYPALAGVTEQTLRDAATALRRSRWRRTTPSCSSCIRARCRCRRGCRCCRWATGRAR